MRTLLRITGQSHCCRSSRLPKLKAAICTLCSEAELLGIHRIMPGIKELFDLAAEVRVMDDLLAYGRVEITWREHALAQYAALRRSL